MAVLGLIVLIVLIVAGFLGDSRSQTSGRRRERHEDVDDGGDYLEKPQSRITQAARSDVIAEHLARLEGSSDRHYVDDRVVRCLAEVLACEGRSDLVPQPREWLWKWKQRRGIPSEYVGLAHTVEASFRARVNEIRDAERKELKTQESEEATRLLSAHSELVEKFLRVTEQKVSTLDEYGDENWAALPAEIKRATRKIAEREGVSVRRLERLEKDFGDNAIEYMVNQPGVLRFWHIRKQLENEFRRRHGELAAKFAAGADVEGMTGVEFETYLARLFREHGFNNVRGTPATGDQGADLLCEKAGRTIVVQAKRYQGAVGNKAVQEVIAALTFYGGDEAWVVTNSRFTDSARALARKAGVCLVDGSDLRAFGDYIRTRSGDQGGDERLNAVDGLLKKWE